MAAPLPQVEMYAAGRAVQHEAAHEQNGQHNVGHRRRQPHHLTGRLHALQQKKMFVGKSGNLWR